MDSSKLLPREITTEGMARRNVLLPRIYPVAALLVLIPLLDVVARTWPPRVADMMWRFGAIGLTLGTLTTPVLGLALAMTLAALLDQPRVLRALATFTLLLAVALAFALAVFALDFLQLRTYLTAGETTGYDAAAVEALIAGGLYLPVLLLLGSGGWTLAPGAGGPLITPDRVVGLGIRPRKENTA